MMTMSELLSEYFLETDPSRPSSRSLLNEEVFNLSNLPVAPSGCSWEIHESPERFSKTFSFSDKKRLISFIQEVLSYEAYTSHDGTHRIEGTKVTVEVYTHDINRITESDQVYIKQIDEIYRDVLDFA